MIAGQRFADDGSDDPSADIEERTVRTSPATPKCWNDVVAVFGKRGDEPGWCWCQRFMEPAAQGAAEISNRDMLRREVETSELPPGVIATSTGNPQVGRA